MKEWEKVVITTDTTILEALRIVDNEALQIALVVNDKGVLLGTMTDGDVRRGLLKGIQLADSVASVMNVHPIVARLSVGKEKILELMKLKELQHIPLVDEDGVLKGLESLQRLLKPVRQDNWVVLMAGGLGSRLAPLTRKCPKPLLKVGDKPILETIMLNFMHYGYYKFYISVNYKAEMIEEYFGDGSRWGVEIRYLRENERLGTAGALGLLPERPQLPLLVMNGDLLTKVNFNQLLHFHTEHCGEATMCIREYKHQVPFGVVQMEQQQLTGIIEKPVQKFFVSAGIYVIEPETLKLIPRHTCVDMPTLFEQMMAQKRKVSVFPIREYWIDIGRLGDFERANSEHAEVFR